MPFQIEHVHSYDAAWDRFVDSHPDATNYHQYAWRDVVEKSFGHEGIYLMARDGAGAVCGVLPLVHMRSSLFGNFLVSVPFFNYGGLLCNSHEAREALLGKAEELRRKMRVDHVELRHVDRHCPDLATKSHKVTMIMDLEADEEGQWKAFNAKLRNQIRKAEKNELTVKFGGAGDIERFYSVFCRNMRDLGTPVYSRKFFREIFETLPTSTRMISIYHQDRIIAAGILVWYKDTLEVPWASSIREFRELCPNNLLYWEAIKFAIRGNLKKFDFGRSTPDGGTFRFKKQWGAVPVTLHWQYLLPPGSEMPDMSPSNPKFQLAIRAWQRLPVTLTRMLGPKIVRSIP